ncbi:MAG: type 4 fimbriae expression regulatory protein PilR [Pseudomonadota bacterium]|jgi:two-component system response regulator PilR (NtrC family)
MSQARPARLLVVDDEPDLRTLYELTLLRDGHDVETAGTVDDARLLITEHQYDAIITDMRLPDGTGLDVLRHLEQTGRSEKAIVITAHGSAENAVEALKAGAFDYLTKPVDLKQFRAVVAGAIEAKDSPAPSLRSLTHAKALRPAAREESATSTPPAHAADPAPAQAPKGRAAAPTLSSQAALSRLIGESSAIGQVRTLIDKVSRSMAPVLLWGESGTGKELVARAIHDVSVRKDQPFIAVNCGAIPEQLLEAEFFGYRKGAFTGAQDDREGFFQAARGGTLFLDEIGDLPLSMQSKLLRAIQERAVRPVGAVAELPVDVRIVSASHKNLGEEVQASRFRQDLYYRLNVIQIALPPLRERLDDLPLICEQVLHRIAAESGLSEVPRLMPSALHALLQHPFPGNVRELENLLHRAVALSAGHAIEAEDLGLSIQAGGAFAQAEVDLHAAESKASGEAAASQVIRVPDAPAPLPADLVSHLDQVEQDILVRALEQHRLNRTAAGNSLGLSLRQMRYRMARLGIQVGAQGVETGERSVPDGELDPIHTDDA